MRSKKLLASLGVLLALSLTAMGCGNRSVPGGGGGGGSDKPTIAFVPKLRGIPYFEAMKKGGDKAAKELGVKFIYQGATTADPAKQAQIVNSLIQRQVDVLAVAPNDPAAIAPVLKRAKDAGIKVITSDTDAPKSVRQFFVAQATNQAMGKVTAKALASQMNGKGKWAIVSCGPTARNLNAWIKVEKQYIKKNYPDMKLVDIKYAGEDQAKSTQLAKDLMTAHPDLKGLIGQCSTSAPGVAKAITNMGKIGEVVSTGVSTPNAMAPYIKSGAMSKVVLWNAVDLGYLTVWAGKQLAQGKQLQATNKVGGGIGTVKYRSGKKWLVLGDPLVFTKKNVDEYDF